MPEFHVNKSIRIAAAPSAVFPLVRDFRNWRSWSPWLLAEPDCQVAYGDDGRSYGWEGKIVGSGRMEIIKESPERFLDYRLIFLKPFKSENRTAIRLEPKDGGTELVWTMTGSLPWFLFWMRGMMTVMIGMDYARGLAMLKDLAESGKVPSSLDFTGEQPFTGFPYVGIRRECPIDKIGEMMTADFEKLAAWRAEQGVPEDGRVVSLYHKWNATRGVTEYTAATEVPTRPERLPGDMVNGSIPDTRVYGIRHTGPYRHLGNAWAAGLMRGRAKVFKGSRKVPPFELYENDPAVTPEESLKVLIQFPLK